MNLKNQVEAALFGAGRPVEVREIVRQTGGDGERVRTALKDLSKEYEARDGALEVVRVGGRWSLQLREAYAAGQELAPTEIPQEALKTAALIAYHQPILQAELKKMVGSGVYGHVRVLRESRLIRAKPEGRSLSLTTTRRFPEYFGIHVGGTKGLRRWLSERAGLDL